MSVQQRLRRLLWKPETEWAEIAVIAAAIIFVITLIGAVR